MEQRRLQIALRLACAGFLAFALTIGAVRSGTPEASAQAARARSAIEPFPFQSALKFILQRRGVAIEDAVRPPLQTLNAEQRQALRILIDDPAGALAALHPVA